MQAILIFVVVLITALVITKQLKEKKVSQGDYSSYGVTKESPIVIFSVQWCPACKALKSYLNTENVKYINLDVENNENATILYKKTGKESYPVIIIADTMIVGFNKREIVNRINILKL